MLHFIKFLDHLQTLIFNQTFFTNMAKTLLQKLPLPPNKYGIDSVKKFYRNLNITTKFQLKQTTKDIVLKLLYKKY